MLKEIIIPKKELYQLTTKKQQFKLAKDKIKENCPLMHWPREHLNGLFMYRPLNCVVQIDETLTKDKILLVEYERIMDGDQYLLWRI